MQLILTVALALTVAMAAVDPRSRYCYIRCEALHEMDCPDEDQCPEISSEEVEDSEADSRQENLICVNPCEDLKNSCTSSCYEAYSLCQAGCHSNKPSTRADKCFRTCFEQKFESLQEAPSP